MAIYCDSAFGPHFNDLGVKSFGNVNAGSYTYLGGHYTNNTGVNGDLFSQVQEIFK
jgi:hypothetical protein